ncbi:hypothetical protein ACA910_018567 [Epithemia clementina (nom. ined.)]
MNHDLSHQDVVSLNNMGIYLLRHGMLDHAIGYFRHCLDKVANGLAASNKDHKNINLLETESTTGSDMNRISPQIKADSNQAPSFDSSTFSTRFLEISNDTERLKSMESPWLLQDHQERLVDHNTLLLHDRAFFFWDKRVGAIYEHDPRMAQDGPLTNIISGLLLFNLALGFHLRAIVGLVGNPRGTNNLTTTSHHLRATQRIYQNALVAFQRGCGLEASRPCLATTIRPTNSPTVGEYAASRVNAPSPPSGAVEYYDCSMMRDQVVLAIYNNLAHLSFHFFEMDLVEHYLAGMRSILFRQHTNADGCPPYHHDGESTRHVNGPAALDRHHFVSNARGVRPWSISPTSPAA